MLKTAIEGTVEEYEAKIKAFEEKEVSLRENLEIFEEEMSNLQEILEDKEANEGVLLQQNAQLEAQLEESREEASWWEEHSRSQTQLLEERS